MLAALAFAWPCAAQDRSPDPAGADEPRRLVIPRIPSPPSLDDVAAGRVPAGMAQVSAFRQQAPADGAPVSRQTTVFVGYDDVSLYAVFVCRAESGEVRARYSRRDDIASDDEVAVYLDTFDDRQHALSFYVNPLGVQADSAYTEGQGDDYSFDTVWHSEGRLVPDGYLVRIAIPFTSLRFSTGTVQRWGFGVARFLPRLNESSYWPYYSTRTEGFVPQLARLEGLERVSSGRNVQLVPYVAGGRSRVLEADPQAGAMFANGTEHRAGLDLKAVIRQALTLDVTVNPDFSQVESNDPQVTSNQRFEVFFPEKRPFFLENASYFQTPEPVVFTRRIAAPDAGVRLTGAAGRWAVGALGVVARVPAAEVSAASAGADAMRGGVAMGRLQRTLGEQSSVGALFTWSHVGTDIESVASIDTRLKMSPNLVWTAQAARSLRRAGGGTSEAGTDLYAQLAYSDLHTSATARYIDRSAAFVPRLGYIPRQDIRQVQQEAGYKFLPAGRLVKWFGPTASGTAIWSQAGVLQDWSAASGLTVELAGQTSVAVTRTEALEVFDGLRFRKPTTLATFSTDASRHAGVRVSYGSGGRVNYVPPSGVRPFAADGSELTLGLTLRPTPHLKVDQVYLRSLLAAEGRGGRILADHLARTTANYQFTRALSARLIVDYAAARPDARLIDLERASTLAVDALVTYLTHPGTAWYIGYTDRRENLAFVPGLTGSVMRTAGTGLVTGRQFFVKASYLLRL